jgi:TonB family protein
MSAEETVGGLLERRDFRRALVGSGVGHLLLAAALLIVPSFRSAYLRPSPVFVDLVAPPRPSAPAMKVQRAATLPVIRQQVEEAVVLRPKPKPKAEPKPPAPEKAKEPVEPAKAEEPVEAPSAAELLARLREKVGEEPQSAARAGDGGGRFDPELAAYHRRVTAVLQSNWAGLSAFRGQSSLVAQFEVGLDGQGAVLELSQTRSSGNRFFDESAERAIRRSAPFPSPPRGPIRLDVVFEPKGVF